MMTGTEFKAWRESHGLTQQQIAERMKVTRTTIQNWEALPDQIPQAADMMAEVFDARLKQENPLLGPLTLVYTDAPMFLDPRGPRRGMPMMQQEYCETNAFAIARVQVLSAKSDFYNPLVLGRNNEMIWNVVQLNQVINGVDTGAPTLINLLRRIAAAVRENSSIFVRRGARSLTQAEVAERKKAIEDQADTLDRIANAGLQAAIDSDAEIEAVFKTLLDLGTRAPDGLVSAVAQVQEVFSKSRTRLSAPRMRGVDWVIDYRDYQISYPQVRLMGGAWPITIETERPDLGARIGRDNLIMAHDREAGILEAARRIDEALRS